MTVVEDTTWMVYLVLCADGTLYCGVTNHMENRLAAHNAGVGAKYTRSRRPVHLVGTSCEMSRGDALRLEYRVKRLPVDKKIQALRKIGL